MVLVIIPDDIEGDKRIKTTRAKAKDMAEKHSKKKDIIIGSKRATPKDILKAKDSDKIKLVNKQVRG